MRVRGQCFSLTVEEREYVVTIMPVPQPGVKLKPVPATLLNKMYRAMHESQPTKITPKLAEKIKERYVKGKTIFWLAEHYGVSRDSVKRIVKILVPQPESEDQPQPEILEAEKVEVPA